MRTISGLLMVLAAGFAAGQGAKTQSFDLRAEGMPHTGVTLAGDGKPVLAISLVGSVAEKSKGKATLTLDPVQANTYDDFGFVTKVDRPARITLECNIAYVESKKVRGWPYRTIEGPVEPPEPKDRAEFTWHLYAITGDKVPSRLFIAVPEGAGKWPEARLLVRGVDGKAVQVIEMNEKKAELFPPCHPGCFPAGTGVRTFNGQRRVEWIKAGDAVLAFDPDGQPSVVRVVDVFKTRNRVLEFHVSGAKLTTTETQPIALVGGGFKSAGELKVGDRVWRLIDGKRREATVEKVSPANAVVEVFNLVLGEPTAFAAGGFLVRSKPPGVIEP